MAVTALVTGGAGFIGSHLARYLIDEPKFSGWEVVVLDDLSGGTRENLRDLESNPRFRFVEGSVTDASLVDSLFEQESFDYVYHLAAYAAEGLSHFIRRFNYTNNVIGSVNVTNAAVRHRAQCIAFASSIAVYGDTEPPMTEDRTPTPIDPYGIAKFAVELDLKAAHDLFGLNYVILRPHNVYGEFQNIGDRYRNVVGIFMNQILRGEPLTVFGDGKQLRAFTYVGDIVAQIARAPLVPDAYGNVFNVGSDTVHSVLELAHLVQEAMGVEAKIRHLDRREEADEAYADHSKAQRILGSRPETPLQEGLRRMADWVKEVGARSTPRFANIEVFDKLPPAWTEGKS